MKKCPNRQFWQNLKKIPKYGVLTYLTYYNPCDPKFPYDRSICNRDKNFFLKKCPNRQFLQILKLLIHAIRSNSGFKSFCIRICSPLQQTGFFQSTYASQWVLDNKIIQDMYNYLLILLPDMPMDPIENMITGSLSKYI